MLKNYLLVALRAFRKHTLHSSLNVFGLALGLTVVLLIALFVRFELSYDQFHERVDRTYRIVQRQPDNFFLGSNEFAVSPRPLEIALRDELAYVEEATVVGNLPALIRADDKSFMDDGVFATPSFFRVFDFDLLAGDESSVLASPNSAVVTPEFADKLFGTGDVVGREFSVVHFRDEYRVTITGIAVEPPANSHLDFSYIVSLSTSNRQENDSWSNSSYYNYVVLRSGTDLSTFQADLQEIVTRNVSELSWVQETGASIATYFPQPLGDLHLRSRANFDPPGRGDVRYVWLLILAATIIMFTACVNYTNLASARSATRAREVGVRKAAGADRHQLLLQFLGESVLLALFAAAIAVAAVKLLLPGFATMVEREIPLSMLLDPSFLLVVPLIAIAVGVISGLYPAVILSRMAPSRVLKSAASKVGSRSRLRNALVVTQFAVSIALVFGTVVINKQLGYIQQADTGMSRDHIVSVNIREWEFGERWPAMRDELSRVPGVVAVTSSGHVPTNIDSSTLISDWDGHQGDDEMTIYRTAINYGYTDLLGLEIVEGRDFEAERAADAGAAVIINETAKRRLGWDSAVGKQIVIGSEPKEVVGVVQDFQYHSSHLEINPLALSIDSGWIRKVLVKVSSDDVSGTVDQIGEVAQTFLPGYPFEYVFLDDAYNSLHRAEQRLSVAFSVITVLALVIACLGLFGLAAFMVVQRRKEIGVRKTLGASLGDIVLLLSRDFSRLVLVAFVIGSPIAYFAMTKWLERFAFRVDVGVGVFVTAGLITLAVTVLTVGFHSVKASLTDPVKALRYE